MMPFSKTAQNMLMVFLKKELIEDSDSRIIKLLYHSVSRYSVELNNFMIFYMFSHSILKIIMVYFLYRKKMWAYPFSIIVLTVFVVYQTYKIFYLHSIMLVVATVVDIILIVLTVLEYRDKKQKVKAEI